MNQKSFKVDFQSGQLSIRDKATDPVYLTEKEQFDTPGLRRKSAVALSMKSDEGVAQVRVTWLDRAELDSLQPGAGSVLVPLQVTSGTLIIHGIEELEGDKFAEIPLREGQAHVFLVIEGAGDDTQPQFNVTLVEGLPERLADFPFITVPVGEDEPVVKRKPKQKFVPVSLLGKTTFALWKLFQRK